jgi:F-type H+-transporting ATPase subunit delta
VQQKYSRSALVQYIVTQLEAGMDTDALSQKVAAYLIEMNKTSDVMSVMRDAQELRAQKYGVVEATATSAHELGQQQLDEVTSAISKQYDSVKRVNINQVHDPTVIGGVVVNLPQATLDVTIRNKLNRLRESIS